MPYLGTEGLIAEEAETKVRIDAASLGQPTNGVEHLTLAGAIGVRDEHSQLVQELCHLGRREFQNAVRVDAIQHRCLPAVLDPLKHRREPEAPVTHYSYLEVTSAAWARAQLLNPDQLNIDAHAGEASNGAGGSGRAVGRVPRREAGCALGREDVGAAVATQPVTP